MSYFVWITGLKGPEPQIWADEPIDGNGKPIKSAIFKIKLSEEEQYKSLDYLAMKYERNKCLTGE